MAVVIVGAGIAGYSVARELRKQMQDIPLVMVTADSGDNVYKPNLSKALAMGKQPDDLVMQPAAAMAEQLQMDIKANTKVLSIDTATQRLVFEDQSEQSYDHLVLALGAQQRVLPIPGFEFACSVNDLADYRRFYAALPDVADAPRVGIVGGGLIGCEFANDLAAAGYAVDVVEPQRWPMASLLPEPCGQVVAEALAELGVQWHWGQMVNAIAPEGAGYALTLSGGQKLSVDVVLSATGLQPNTQLASEADLAVNRGIVVDGFMQASAPHVFAIGDCAELDGQVLPYVAPIMQQAKAVAATLSGTVTEVSYSAMPVAVKTPACPVVVSPVYGGGTVAPDAWQLAGTGQDWVATYGDSEQPQGFVLTGDKVKERMQWMRKVPAWR